MLQAGEVLQERYRIVALMGKGGMGAVYRAWDTRLNVHVAVKEMLPQPGLDSTTLAALHQQFHEEARVVARLKHPSLVSVTDFFEQDDNAYLVMTFVEGENLAARIQQVGALPEAEVVSLAAQLLDALAYCHDQGIIHRDIKPQNVIIRPDGRPVLVDFGLVKLWNPADPRTRTAMRGMGTPEYAPPEQYEVATSHTDPRSDIYSLGATLYHALTGRAPPTATMRIANPALFQTPRALNASISPNTEAVILRATELSLNRRFSSAREMAAALARRIPAYGPLSPSATQVYRTPPSPPTGMSGAPVTPAGILAPPQRAKAPASTARPWLWAGIGLGGGLALAVCLVVAGVLAVPQFIWVRTPTRSNEGLISETSPTRLPVVATTAPTPVPAVNTVTAPPAPAATAPPPAPTSEPRTDRGIARVVYVHGDVGNTDIHLIGADGSSQRCLACQPCDEAEPGWSPDGRYVVFQSNCGGTYDIWMIGAAGGEPIRLTSAGTDEREPDWSPDGSQIVFRVNEGGQNRNRDGDLHIMEADGRSWRSLGISGRAPVWSPDGSRILFMSERDGSWQIYIYDLYEGAVQRVTSCDNSECRWPDWSPDGRMVVFHTTTGRGSTDADTIWAVPIGGGNYQMVVTGEHAGRASWCGELIVFNSDRGVETVRPDGSGRRTLVSGNVNWAPACFSEDR